MGWGMDRLKVSGGWMKMDGWMDGWVYGWTDEWIRWVDGWTCAWMDRWINRNRRKNKTRSLQPRCLSASGLLFHALGESSALYTATALLTESAGPEYQPIPTPPPSCPHPTPRRPRRPGEAKINQCCQRHPHQPGQEEASG